MTDVNKDLRDLTAGHGGTYTNVRLKMFGDNMELLSLRRPHTSIRKR
jgi:hypothetical protein